MSKKKFVPPDSSLSIIVAGALIAVVGAAVLGKSPGMLVLGLIAVVIAVRWIHN